MSERDHSYVQLDAGHKKIVGRSELAVSFAPPNTSNTSNLLYRLVNIKYTGNTLAPVRQIQVKHNYTACVPDKPQKRRICRPCWTEQINMRVSSVRASILYPDVGRNDLNPSDSWA
jgi:hypothetical protein